MSEKESIKRKWFSNVLIAIGTIIFCFIILELGLRILDRLPSNSTVGINEQWRDSYRLIRDNVKTINYPAFSYTVRTSSLGFRYKKTGMRDLGNKPIHVFLGASDVFGNGVDYEDSFVGIFEKYASTQGIEVINMANGGHYFKDQMVLLKDFMSETNKKPSKLFFCTNGLHIPKFDKMNKNIVVKGGYTFRKDGWQLSYIRLMIGNISSAYCFFRDALRLLQADMLDFKFKDETPEFIQTYSKSNRMFKPEVVQQYKDYLDSVEQFCNDNDITLVYIYLPLADSFTFDGLLKELKENPENFDTAYYERLMVTYCKDKNINLVNLKPLLQKYHDEGKDLRFQLDPHYNHFTNRIVGEYLVKHIFSLEFASQ